MKVQKSNYCSSTVTRVGFFSHSWVQTISYSIGRADKKELRIILHLDVAKEKKISNKKLRKIMK
jgi:hypothetical protein